MAINKHEIVEKNVGVLMVMICVAISFATLVEIVPLFFQKELNEPLPGMKPLTALQLEGRDVYIREGCHVCHTQMIRPLRAETERMAIIRWLVNQFGITHSCGVLNVLAQI